MVFKALPEMILQVLVLLMRIGTLPQRLRRILLRRRFLPWTPPDDAINVGISDNLVIIFDEDVQGTGTGLIRIKNGVGTTKENFNLPDPNVTFSGNTVTINPTSDLDYGSDYYMEIPNDGIEDLAGNDFTGISANTTWNFTTEDAPDVTPPAVVTLNPANGSNDVANNTDLVLTFDEDVQLTGAGLFKMFNKADDQQIGVSWSFDGGATVSGNEVTYNIPIDLPYGTEIYVEITNAIEDLAGNNAADITGNSDWFFTTEGELVSPVITLLSPSNGSIDVAIDTDLVLTFDETVQLTGIGGFKMFNKADDSQIGVNWSFSTFASVNGNEVTFDIPIGLPYSTEIYFEITNAIEDAWGNPAPDITGNSGWVITTEKENQTISFDPPPTKTYGDMNFTLSGSASSGLTVTYDSSDPTVATVAGNVVTIIGAGSTTITASQAGDSQYNPAADVMQNLVIDKALLTATADDKNKIYGDPNPGFSLSFTGFVNGDNSSVLDVLPPRSTSATSSSDVGDYDIAVSGGSDNNYEYAYVNGTLTVTRAQLFVIADDKTKVFGDPIPAFTYSYTGFVNGDDENDLDSHPTAVTLATQTSNVGTYDIDLAGGSDNNYAVGLTQGTLTITKADQVITIDPITDMITTDGPFSVNATTTSRVDTGLLHFKRSCN